jgi:hypothetical protein
MALDLVIKKNMPTNIQYKDKVYKCTSRMVRKNASIFPLVKPLGREVCRSAVPRTTEARHATLKVNPAMIEANTRSATRCCALQSEVASNKNNHAIGTKLTQA